MADCKNCHHPQWAHNNRGICLNGIQKIKEIEEYKEPSPYKGYRVITEYIRECECNSFS